MKNTGNGAVKRIFVKVFGFSDVERHALNTVFRLSESRPTAYALWTAAAPAAAEVALIDGDSWEAALELANPSHDPLKLIWVGDRAPARASLVMARPLQWAAVIEGMDALFARAPAQALPAAKGAAPDADLDLDLLSESIAGPDQGLDVDSEAVTAPAPLESPEPLEPSEPDPLPVLVVDADPAARLYLRAKLAMAELMQIDEAATGAEALQRLRTRRYALVILDLGLPDMDSWLLVKQVGEVRPAVGFLILTGSRVSWLDGVRGWFAGARGCLRKPLHPGKLKQLLRNVH